MTRNTVIGLLIATFSLSIHAGAASAKPTVPASSSGSYEHKHHGREAARQRVVLSATAVSGVVPRALRGSDPLQMLNPGAPAGYGTAADSVSIDPDVPGQVDGIKLVSVSF